jgi:PIN domain nuclease of toxin-antitoxin system
VDELVAVISDTHPLIFYAAKQRSLSKTALVHFKACERQEKLIYVPAAVVWETCLLARRNRINLRRSAREFFGDLFSNPAFQPFELDNEQIYIASEIRPNDDPFDGLICAAALSLGLPLITRDSDITNSGLVKVIW